MAQPLDYSKWDKVVIEASSSDDDDESMDTSPPAQSKPASGKEKRRPASDLLGAVIFLHGSGDSGWNLQQGLRMMGFEQAMREAGLKLICPTAKRRPYSLMGGGPSNVWFDRTALSFDDPEDTAGIDDSYSMILDVIVKLMDEGIACNHVYVGGFSMGGGMALHFLSKFRRPLAGVFTMSSFLSSQTAVYTALSGGPPCPPILMCHGEEDSLIPYDWGFKTARAINQALAAAHGTTSSSSSTNQISFYKYEDADHEIDPRMLRQVLEWILRGPGVSLPSSGPDLLAPPPPPPGPIPSQASSSSSGQPPLPQIEFTLEPAAQGNTKATFKVPVGREGLFTSGKPVSARGSHFIFDQTCDAPGTVSTTFYSPDPQATAKALAEKIAMRVRNPENVGIDTCTPS